MTPSVDLFYDVQSGVRPCLSARGCDQGTEQEVQLVNKDGVATQMEGVKEPSRQDTGCFKSQEVFSEEMRIHLGLGR